MTTTPSPLTPEADSETNRRRLKQLLALSKPSEAELEYRRGQVRFLRRLAQDWYRTGQEPAAVRALCGSEYTATCIAARQGRLEDTFYSFMMLDGWLQAFILEERGLAHFVGTKVGTDEI